jgi:hypothetical protein
MQGVGECPHQCWTAVGAKAIVAVKPIAGSLLAEIRMSSDVVGVVAFDWAREPAAQPLDLGPVSKSAHAVGRVWAVDDGASMAVGFLVRAAIWSCGE